MTRPAMLKFQPAEYPTYLVKAVVMAVLALIPLRILLRHRQKRKKAIPRKNRGEVALQSEISSVKAFRHLSNNSNNNSHNRTTTPSPPTMATLLPSPTLLPPPLPSPNVKSHLRAIVFSPVFVRPALTRTRTKRNRRKAIVSRTRPLRLRNFPPLVDVCESLVGICAVVVAAVMTLGKTSLATLVTVIKPRLSV